MQAKAALHCRELKVYCTVLYFKLSLLYCTTGSASLTVVLLRQLLYCWYNNFLNDCVWTQEKDQQEKIKEEAGLV